MSVLIFSDSHIEPGQDLTRFSKLGNFIVQEKPSTIIDLGDTFSLSAISGWDLSKRLTMEGRRYQQDCSAGNEAITRLFSPLKKLQIEQSKDKKKKYSPTVIRLKGNHEYRENVYLEQNPEMKGMLDIDKLTGYSDFYTECIEYRERYVYNGISFMHCPLGGNDQPLSGVCIPYKTLQRFVGNVVVGHYHRYEISSGKRIDSDNIHKAVICPAFFDGQPTYLSPSAPACIDRGVLLMDVCYKTGVPYFKEVPLEELYANY